MNGRVKDPGFPGRRPALLSLCGALTAAALLVAPAPAVGPLGAADAGAQASERARAGEVIGREGMQHRNQPIRLGADARVSGLLETRNGPISIGPRSRVRSLSSRNGRIEVAGLSSVEGSVDTRNGRISLGEGVTVTGAVHSRNGRIELGEGARAGGRVETRNGSITLAPAAGVSGDVRTRNGAVTLRRGAWVEGGVRTRNGSVRLEDARVARSVDVHAGDLDLVGATVIEGDVIVLRDRTRMPGWLSFLSGDARDPVVRIGADVRIGGRLVVDERARVEIAPGAAVPTPERFDGRAHWDRRR